MAGKNGKPKERPAPDTVPRRPERKLTVSSIFYEHKDKKAKWPGGGKTSTKVPWIRMQGKWLEEAGFEISKSIRIRVMAGCLVLTVD